VFSYSGPGQHSALLLLGKSGVIILGALYHATPCMLNHLVYSLISICVNYAMYGAICVNKFVCMCLREHELLGFQGMHM
jgi:hypothetical protein